MVRAALSEGLSSRLLMACRASTVCAATFTGSTPVWGMAPWQPLPWMRISNMFAAGALTPGAETITVPTGMGRPVMT